LVTILGICYGFEGYAQSPVDTSVTKITVDSLSIDSTKIDSISIKQKKKGPIDLPIKYNAVDSIIYDIVNSKVYLYNKAEVYYGNINLKADYIIIDQIKKTVYAKGVSDSTGKVSGKPVFTDAGQVYNSEEMSYNFETKKGKIKEVTTQEGQGYLLANDVKKNQYNEVFIRHGKFTTCNLPHPHFYIALTKAKNIEDKTVSGPAYLVVEDVPLPLALPFGFFPRKSGRSSGILMPEIGEDRELGFFLRNGGFYFGINDNVDLAIRADIFSKGSYGFSAFSRYNVRYKFNGNFTTTYNDRRFGEPNTSSYIRNKDFSIRWTHNQDPKAIPGTRFSASVNIATRNNFRNNITTNLQSIVQNDLNSSISFSKSWEGTPFSLNGSMTHNQSLSTGIVSLGLPSISFNMSRIFPFDSKNRVGPQKWYHKIGVSYTADALNRITTTDSLLFETSSLDRFQNGVRHTIPVSTSFNVLKYLTVSPFVNYNERWYFNSITKQWNGSDVLIDTISGFKRAMEYNAGMSLTTRVYGMFPVNAGGIEAIRHVLTPVLSYSYRPDFSQSQFGYYQNVQSDSTGSSQLYSIFENNNGIYGSPGAGRSSLLSYSLDNNLEMKIKTKTDTGDVTKKIRIFDSFRFTGNYNMAADSLKFSNVNVVARTVLFGRLNIDLGATYDLYTYEADSNNVYRRVNKFEYNENKRLGRLISANLSIGTNLNPDAFKSKKSNNNPANNSALRNRYNYAEVEMINRFPQYYVDWSIPWNLAINYNLSYNKPLMTATTTQALNVSGDISVTPKWKIGFLSGYDFTTKEITPTSLNIYRDLHCWDLSINWIPFGTYQRYSVDLKVRASILQDLKLSRRREFYERE
jgi:lipopolysaccharide assembly outer membrane protein LptD (OstA)